ncbi:hypothetical protein [Nitrosomonas ureae]|uniref:hypothetical protein n=1 Tax=Nitrosomonas ureae TaxID=44577 RepID=UPI0021091DBE|nr:hypothetical protein [Nitrosomonas ureae]
MIEIKKGTSLSLGRGFHEACEDIKLQKKFILYAGKDRFPLSHAITAIALFDFMEILKEKKNNEI